MPLPIKKYPTYELTLPSTKETIKYRPYLTGEQTIIMMAMEGDDINEITNTVKQIVSNCVLTTPFDVEKLTMIDLEYIMLCLRAKSVSNIVELTYKCKNYVPEKEAVCDNEVKCAVNLDEVKVDSVFPENKIDLYEDDELGTVGVIMKYPTVGTLKKHPISELNTAKGSYKLIASCISAIYDSQKVYDTTKESPAELNSFLMALTVEQFGKITQWMNNLPKLTYKLTFRCDKCGYEHNTNLEGLYGFFG